MRRTSSRTNVPGGLDVQVGALVILQIAFEIVPIGRLDGVDLHVQAVVVHDVERENRFFGSRIEGDKVAIRPGQEGFGGADLESEHFVPAKFLSENILDLRAHRDPVGGAAFGGAADADGIAQDIDRYTGDLRLDLQHALVVGFGIQGVVELDEEGHQGRAVVLVPGAAVTYDLQRRVGVEAVGSAMTG